MMKSLMVALLVVGAVSAAPYPRYELVVRDPKSNDLLYGTNSEPHTDIWYFANRALLTSIILPSQIINFCRSGLSTTYEEAIDIILHESSYITGNSVVQHDYVIATGSFNGTVSYGQEVNIPLWNATLGRAPWVQNNVYNSIHKYTTIYKYTLEIVFKTSGIYPWYNTRTLPSYSIVSSDTNGAGIAIGLTYTF